MSYKLVKLKEIGTYINGRAFKTTDWENEGKPIIRIQNLNDNNRPYNYTKKEFELKYLVKKGDILISWSASLGIFQWEYDDAWLNQHIFKVVFDKKEVNKNYFKFIVKSNLKHMENLVHGTTMKHITKAKFDNIEVPLPPIDIQIKIANALDKAQELIDNKKMQLEKYDELLQSVFMDMFGDPVTNPKKWKLVEVNKFANIITGNTPSRQEKDNYGEYIEWIKSDNINTPYTYLTEASEYLSEKGVLKGRIIEKDSILMTCIAGSLSCIGNIAITDRKVAFNQQINGLVPQNNINLFFMYRLMIEAKKIIQNASTGGMKGMVNKGILSKLKFILPPLPLQRRFASIMEKVENEKKLCEESLEQMEENFNSIIDKAFKGELF